MLSLIHLLAGRLIFEIRKITHRHSHTLFTVLIRTSEQLVAGASTYTTNTRDKNPYIQLDYLFCCSLFVLYSYLCLCLDCPPFCLLSLFYNTYNINIHAPGGIRTRVSSNNVAVDLRLRPRGHWDRLTRMLANEYPWLVTRWLQQRLWFLVKLISQENVNPSEKSKAK